MILLSWNIVALCSLRFFCIRSHRIMKAIPWSHNTNHDRQIYAEKKELLQRKLNSFWFHCWEPNDRDNRREKAWAFSCPSWSHCWAISLEYQQIISTSFIDTRPAECLFSRQSVKNVDLTLDIRYKPFLPSKCLYIVIRWRKVYNMWYAISYIKYPDLTLIYIWFLEKWTLFLREAVQFNKLVCSFLISTLIRKSCQRIFPAMLLYFQPDIIHSWSIREYRYSDYTYRNRSQGNKMIVAEREKCFNIGVDRKKNLPQSGLLEHMVAGCDRHSVTVRLSE